MPAPFLVPVTQVKNVAAGATANIELEPVGTYHEIRLRYTANSVLANAATIAADILAVRVRLDGTAQWDLTGAQLQAMNAMRGIAHQDGEIPLYFSESTFRKLEQGADYRSWGMQGVSQFDIEVEIAGGATTPKLEAFAVRDPLSRPNGEIRKFKRGNVQVAATGEITVNTFPRNDRYAAIHCVSSNITKFQVKVNDVEHIRAAPAVIHAEMKEHALVPQSGYSHLQFDRRNRTLEMLEPFVVNNGQKVLLPFEVTFTMGSAASFNVVRELLGPRD